MERARTENRLSTAMIESGGGVYSDTLAAMK